MTKIFITEKQCRICLLIKSISEFTPRPASKDGYKNECKDCCNKQNRLLERKKGHVPYNENKSCSWYIGVYIAEPLLLSQFRTAQRMPHNNHGYDFICGNGFKIDVKSSCRLFYKGNKFPHFIFTTKHNTAADYFACVAIESRSNPIPLYYWLIPSKDVEHLKAVVISENQMHKYDKYQKQLKEV
jgi:hypothetical protein